MPVLAMASKKPPASPTPVCGVLNSMAIGPLNVGVPESTGEVGFAPSFTVNVIGEVPLSVNGPVGFPTTQPVRAASGGQVAAVPIAWPEKKPPKVTVGEPAPPPYRAGA